METLSCFLFPFLQFGWQWYQGNVFQKRGKKLFKFLKIIPKLTKHNNGEHRDMGEEMYFDRKISQQINFRITFRIKNAAQRGSLFFIFYFLVWGGY